MRQINQRFPARLGLAIGCIAVLALWVLLDWPCMIRALTGLPCPMCGMSRAWKAALTLNLSAAIQYHALFWSVPIFFWLMLSGAQRKPERLVLASCTGLFVLYYLIRLAVFLF